MSSLFAGTAFLKVDEGESLFKRQSLHRADNNVTRQFEHNCVCKRGAKRWNLAFCKRCLTVPRASLQRMPWCVAAEDALISVQTPLLSLFFVVVIFTPHRKRLSENHALCNRA